MHSQNGSCEESAKKHRLILEPRKRRCGMNQQRNIVTIGMAFLCFSLCARIATAQTQAAHRVQVVLSAQEAAVRTSLANLDIYSVRIQPKKGPAIDGIALDRYPYYQEGLPHAFIDSSHPLFVRLRRTPYCDRMNVKSDTGTLLPCFTVVHGSWTLPKNQARDEWWK